MEGGAMVSHKNKIIKVDDAKMIFESFYHSGEIPQDFIYRDITHMFKWHELFWTRKEEEIW